MEDIYTYFFLNLFVTQSSTKPSILLLSFPPLGWIAQSHNTPKLELGQDSSQWCPELGLDSSWRQHRWPSNLEAVQFQWRHKFGINQTQGRRNGKKKRERNQVSSFHLKVVTLHHHFFFICLFPSKWNRLWSKSP